MALLAALLGWPYGRLEPELRKAFEVALHGGTAVALLLSQRSEVVDVVRKLSRRRALGAALTFAPAALAGYSLGEPIVRRTGAPRWVAAAQVAGGIALGAADRRPDTRRYEEAGALDHLAIGLAQAVALVPGVSRNGATLTAARLRRLDRRAASRLSRHAALPVIVGATALEGTWLARRSLPAELGAAFSLGAGAALASTLAARGLLGHVERTSSYLPLAAYRVVLGAAATVALRRREHSGVRARSARVAEPLGRPLPFSRCASMAR
jgi:undecaprenyl-diphosphatase